MLNLPNNPTGAACTREELAAIAAVMRRHPQVWIMADDMYEHLCYDGFEHHTIAEVEPALKRPHADGQRRVQDLRHDRLAHRLRRRAEAADQGDDQRAGPGDRRHLDRRPGGGGRGAGRAAGRGGASRRRPTSAGRDMVVEGLNACAGHHLP